MTSRQPADIPAFSRAMLSLFEESVIDPVEDEFAFRERIEKPRLLYLCS